MKYLIMTVAITGLLGLSACQNATDTSTPKSTTMAQQKTVPKFSAAAFYQTTAYGLASGAGHAFGPTSGDLLITSDQSGVFNAYRLNPETGDISPLTASTTNPINAVSWFPSDERMLYTSDGGGDELNHIYVRGVDGSVKDLTPGDNIKAAFMGWHEDGNHFFLMSNERDARTFDIYKYNAKNYSRDLIFENDGKQIDSISKDGNYIALTKNRTSADSDIYVACLDAEDTSPKLITEHEGNIAHSAYSFSVDSKALIYATNEFGEFNQAWVYMLDSGKTAKLISEDWDVSFVTHSPRGRYRVSGVNADGSTRVTIMDNKSGAPVAIKDLPEGNVGNVRFSQDESQIAFIMNGDRAPSNIHIASLETGTQSALTSALNPDIKADMLVEGKVTRYKSFDGLDVPGILYKPHGASAANPVPAMIMVHGGPGGQNRKGYRAQVQHMVNHGYAVYAMNNRGSSGYGKTFYHLDDKKHGDVDLKDVIWSKKYMAEQDWVDGDKIGIIGGSYGGYMVAAALAFEPDEFDVGINIFGVTNWIRTLKSIPPWWESFKEQLYDEMGDPAVDEVRHRAISPLFHAENITKPMLVVQGANDPRVLQVESDEIVAAVKANGVAVDYIVFPDEGHGFRKKANRITASNAYVKFLDTYLKAANEG